MRPMRRMRHAALAGLLLATSVLLSGASTANVLVLPVEPAAIARPVTTLTYPSYAPDGERLDDLEWRVVRQVGNCCENYLATTADGRLVNFGGTYVYYSDDEGVTWSIVRPPTPLLSGEGAVAVAPGGDIVGVGWDPYTGDHLQGFKYDAAEKQWYYTEMPLHVPFYDRPWIAVIAGPVTVLGETVPYASVIRGAWPSKEVMLVAADGLRYVLPSIKDAESALRPTVTGPLEVVGYPDADYAQAHSATLVTGLGGGAAYGPAGWPNISTACSTGRFVTGPDYGWACYQGSGEQVDWQVADSEGWLHAVTWSPNGTLTYRNSRDSGENVLSTVLPFPPGVEVTGPRQFDIKANAQAGVVAIATHARTLGASTSQHMVFKLVMDEETGEYELDRILLVGKGDLAFGAGVGTSVRFDFASIAILPDGRVAVSFNDTDHTNPAVAIELPEDDESAASGAASAAGTRWGGGWVEPPLVPPPPPGPHYLRDVPGVRAR